ncbi:MAG: lysophospholipid acyltransferase family protein [Vicinamibacterales bacterium]|jgi:hypothetical protein
MAETTDWRQSPRKRAEVAAIAALGYPVVRALCSTWTWKVTGAEHVDAITRAGHQPILALWHGRILAATPYFQRRGIVAMASENFDGEWIARLLGKFGYGAARGSTSRGGPAALRQLVRDVKAHGVAFTLDGPRGPAEVAQPGAVWLARATGQPLLPFHSEAASSWTLNSWDRTQIPKPFTTVAMAIRQPIYVPRDADAAALEACRRELEASLAAARLECRRQLS